MKKNNIRILIDVDDTIEYLCKAWVEWLDNKYNTGVKYDDITEWNINKFFPKLKKEQIYEPLHTDEFWKSVKPMKDAIKYVRKLMKDGFDVYLCTSTDYRNVKPKFEYIIMEHFPYISWDQVIVAYNKHMIKADILVDDGVHNIVGGDFYGILFTAPHNKSFDAENNGVVRANNWSEVYNIIKMYEKMYEKENK